MIKVRRAKPTGQDIEWLFSRFRKFGDLYGTKHPIYSDSKPSRDLLVTLIESHVVMIADRDAVPVGFIIGMITPHLFNPALKVLAELFWWVDEGHRQTRAGLLLLREFTAWGMKNCQWVTMCILEGRTPVNESTLTRMGFKLNERSYLMEAS